MAWNDPDVADDDPGERLSPAEQQIAQLRRLIEREHAARQGRRELQRLAVEATTVDGVVRAIVNGASAILGAHITSVALLDGDHVRLVHGTSTSPGLGTDTETVPLTAELPLVRALDDDATWIELCHPDQVGSWPELVAERERTGVVAYIAIPMRSRSSSTPIASLGFAFVEPIILDHLDRELLDELIRLASDTLVRAANLQDSRHVAETLQHALLPNRLPTVDGLTLRSLYEPSHELTDVGGDWYDVVPFPDGRVGLVVGDAAGHDVTSAAEMGRVRHVLASHLLQLGDPAAALTSTDAYFNSIDVSMFATAVVIVIDDARDHLTVASAGHLPPLIVNLDGVSAVEVVPGPPIGSGMGGYGHTSTTLAPGAAVVAFTDGVVERRGRSLDEAVGELAAKLSTSSDPSPAAIVGLMRDHLETPDRSDDAAVVIAVRT